jgi:PAS domain S-box-containing protein
MVVSGPDWQTFREVIERAGEAVMVTDAAGRIVLWNQRAEETLGYTAAEAIGRPCWDVLCGYDGNGNRLCLSGCHLMRLVDVNEPIRPIDMRARDKAGEEVLLNMSTVGVPIAGGGWILIHALRNRRAAPGNAPERGREESRPGAGGRKAVLSNREREVLRLLAAGCNTRAAAARLHLAPDTVRNHVRNIFKKLGVHSRPAAVGRAAAEQLL